jgi:soluble cytochrome b562
MEVNMSVAGIASTGISQLFNVQRNFQQVQSEFKQLGQDLQAGNLTQAQTDFVTLSQSFASAPQTSTSSVSQALNSLGQALQSGNLAAAQQAFANLPPNMVGPSAVSHHSHAHGAFSSGQQNNSFSQALSQLGQALQSGNLSAAQQAFSAMQQTWQQFGQNSGLTSSSTGSTPSQPVGGSLSVTA